MVRIDPNTLKALANSPLFTIVEFFTAAAIITLTYLILHKVFKARHISTKLMLLMLFGTLAYTVSKVFVITFIARPYVESLYIRPF